MQPTLAHDCCHSHPHPHPFVKWAGGKTQILQSLARHLPDRFNNYFEPFLGGGAMFFFLAPRIAACGSRAYLSDVNAELINAYRGVRSNVEQLIELLELHVKEYKKYKQKYYYRLRSTTYPPGSLESSARFIALNKTCYNGLYRVNSKGKFNVPAGSYVDLVYGAENLRDVSAVLRSVDAVLLCKDYSFVLERARKGDFVYFDPPYMPVSRTSSFTAYTPRGFGYGDQVELARVFRKLHERGCKVMLSNSDTGDIKELYQGFEIVEVKKVRRSINSDAARRSGHGELVVRNYAS